MAKAVVDAGTVDVDLLGNVLAPFYKSWANNSVNYYTQVPPDPTWQAGNPFMAQPCVYGYNNGTPIYRWFPVRPSNTWNGAGAIPVRAITPSLYSGFPEPPPIDTLAYVNP
jgi:hypothetical protein